MAYAVEATATTDVVKTNISSVEITGIDTPVSNTALDTSAVCATQGVSTTALLLHGHRMTSTQAITQSIQQVLHLQHLQTTSLQIL